MTPTIVCMLRRMRPLGAAAVLALPIVPGVAAAQSRQATRVDTTVAFDKNGTVDLSLISGEIIVTAWNRAEARVQASIEDDGVIRYEISRGQIMLRVDSEDGDNRRSRRNGNVGEARFELMVPVGTRVEASGVSGDVTVRGTRAAVDASSVSGDVEVTDAASRASVNSVSGDVTVRGVAGDARVRSVSGDVTANDVQGDLRAESVSGELLLDNVRSSSVSVKTVSGEIAFSGPLAAGGRYEFNSHSGDIQLRLPEGTNAALSVETYSGELDSDFPVTLQPTSRERGPRRRRMEFSLGSGGATIMAQTFSGNITLERATGRTRTP
jgi:hypothetical protein